MGRKMMVRYLILMTFLVICAGAAWYFTEASRRPQDNAVLAMAPGEEGIFCEQ